jgi:hypothetical protein
VNGYEKKERSGAMGSDDTVERVARNIITRFYAKCNALGGDDSVFALDLKTILEGVQAFLAQHSEYIDNPDHIIKNLYQYGKSIWQNEHVETDNPSQETDPDYLDYYFEHLFCKENWPP